jgi:hypothetical protein
MKDALSLDLLSALLELSSIHRISLELFYNQLSNSNTRMHLSALFSRCCHLKSLTLLPLEIDGQYGMFVDALLAIVPSQVKHLTFTIQNHEQMERALTTMQHLWSISFNFPYHRKIDGREAIDWLSSNGRIFTYSETDRSLSFWVENV